jgi:hypothetical protein
MPGAQIGRTFLPFNGKTCVLAAPLETAAATAPGKATAGRKPARPLPLT